MGGFIILWDAAKDTFDEIDAAAWSIRGGILNIVMKKSSWQFMLQRSNPRTGENGVS